MTAFVLISVPVLGAGTFVAMLSGTQEVPPVNSVATGEAVFTLSPDGTTLTYRVTVANLSGAVASHIHIAPVGVNGPVAVPLFSGSIPGPFTGVLAEGIITSASLTGPLLGMPLDALIAEISAGRAYVNVHTLTNPGGELRGQVMLQVLP
ncbi:MAG: CHRD domain-containing protein [Chloroflexi bacterium]|nr:CHRD domain-containing protein [Chloroflexota bacterium]